MESLDTLPQNIKAVLPEFIVADTGSGDGHLPAGDYFPRKEDFESRFVTPSSQRSKIYDRWNKHREALSAAGLPDAARQLLNGSYTTTKARPGDIDLVVEVPDADRVFADNSQLQAIVRLLQGPDMKPEYDCDAYPIFIFPPEHRDYRAVTLEGIRYWTKWFARSRSGVCKGRVWATVGGFHE